MMRPMIFCALLATAAVAAPQSASAQASGERSLSVMAGAFYYDFEGDAASATASVRLDRRISRNLTAEVGLSFGRAEVTVVDNTPAEPVARQEDSSLGAATVGLNAELPLGMVRPYAGLAVGVFGRYDPEGGDRFVRPTLALPVGARADLTERLGLRAEARLRFDEHQGGASAVNSELLAGVTWVF